MSENSEHITSAQEWSVRFTSQGKEKFRALGGSQQLSDWSYAVSVPAREGRTEKELVEEVRALGSKKIFQECQKDGLEVSLEDIRTLETHENLEGSRR
ncbi:hypothetical protein [Marinobacter litoralis]|uniref:hypothetical protein n=1 Tax=Marinobacter litoralis TaxID=187981 RepID=UPI0018ED08E2|nr:hypothetical protein [Marinobacter litoralis]MBJ6136397.1 hypothetical protein [Marinobacter litoralis]